MAIQLLPVILTAIRAGVPAAKLISKYGKTAYKAAKKLYNKAKADIKRADEIDIEKGEWIKSSNLLKAGLGIGVITTGALKYTKPKLKKKENIRSSKDKKFKGHSSYKE
mgnify:CR=1 FL=1